MYQVRFVSGRALRNLRYADAGYEEALDEARRKDIRSFSLERE